MFIKIENGEGAIRLQTFKPEGLSDYNPLKYHSSMILSQSKIKSYLPPHLEQAVIKKIIKCYLSELA